MVDRGAEGGARDGILNGRFACEAALTNCCNTVVDSSSRPNSRRRRRFAECQKRTSALYHSLRKFGIEKDVERGDLAIANNDDIQSGVVWGLAVRA
jgi:hypothetical protein